MALTLFRDMLNMAFNEESFPWYTEMLAPHGDSKVSKEDNGAWTTPPGLWWWEPPGKTCSMLFPLPGPCLKCGHCWIDCPTLPQQCRPVFPSSFSTAEISQTFWVQQLKAPASALSRTMEEPRVAGKSFSFSWYVDHLDYILGTVYPPQIADGVGR